MRKLRVSIALTLLATCTFTQSNAAVSPGYVFSPLNANRVIIFVHGIFGDTFTTWKNEQGLYFWSLMREDSVYQNTTVYVYGFPSRFFSSSFTIDNAVTDLYTRLKNDDVFKHQQVLFVGHSMGGLVIEALLLRYRELARQVPLIFLFSTPHEGADIATLARYISGNLALDTMLPGDKNQYLGRLDQDWNVAKTGANFPTKLRCAYETRDTYGKRVVTMLSATRRCEGESVPVDANHLEIAKPSGRDSGAYVALRTAVKDISFPSGTVANVDTAGTATVDAQAMLFDATTSGNLPLLEVALRLGAKVNATTPSKDTALMLAADRGYVDIVKVLIAKSDINGINMQSNQGVTALYSAALGCRVEVASLLLKAGADPKLSIYNHPPAPPDNYDWTPRRAAEHSKCNALLETLPR